MMNSHQRLEWLRQRSEQIKKKPTFNWQKISFDKQIDFIADPNRLKAMFTTRRAAKSYTDGIYLIKEADETPNCNCLFLSLTRASSKGIIWKDVLKDINTKNNLGIQFHETDLTATMPNGSVIYVAGVDVDENERKKLFGRKYKLVIIDEAALFGIDLHDLVYVVLRPSVTDLRGTIVMSGMASNITRGLFYDITTRKEPGWSLHTWSAHNNPHVAIQWAEELEWIAKHQPELMKTTRFRQAYLNEWVVDDAAKIYKYNELINRAYHLPYDISDWHYVLGVDLAHSPDSTAFVVSAYHESSTILYFTYSRKHLKMDLTDVANERARLNTKHNFDVEVADGANKQALAELNNRLGCKFIPADKTGKEDFIKLMNDEFIQGNIKLLPEAYNKHDSTTDSLADEYGTLVWITEDGKVIEPRKEDPRLHNDQADSALYNWRHTYQYLRPSLPKKVVDWNKQESWETAHIHKISEEVRRKSNPNALELDHDPNLFNFDMDEDGL